MSIIDNIRDRIVSFLWPNQEDDAYRERVEYIVDRREYRLGKQKHFIKVRPNQQDDNMIMNFITLIVDRTVSMLFGKGVEFDYGEDEAAQAKIDETWEDNKKNIILHREGMYGAEAGMCFMKIVPQEGENHRLVDLDPLLMDIKTEPDDWQTVIEYIIQWRSMEYNERTQRDEEVSKKEVTSLDEDGEFWTITKYEQSRETSNKWVQVGDVVKWDYPFAPIVHWQNLTNVGSPWGLPDITDNVIVLQDRLNFVASNISKVIRYYAHPQRWGRQLGEALKSSMGPDDLINLGSSPDAMIDQLDALGDMTAAMTFLNTLRQSVMDITRTVDVSSLDDKLGAITNFGLRVLYQDALQKLATKRELYGEALEEINRRMLELYGIEPAEVTVVWPDPLPDNEKEETEYIASDMGLGLLSKQTASERRGYVWEDELQRIEEEKISDQANSNNIGDIIMKNFDKGV